MTKSRKLRRPRVAWTEGELAKLRELYPHQQTAKILEHFPGRSLSTVYQKAQKLGLRKTAEYLASPDAQRLRRNSSSGEPFRFPKGHVPANKGLRRPGWGPGRMKETQFKKGEMAGAAQRKWQPIGTEVLDGYGYRKVKVADDRTVPSRFNWRYLHVMTWEEAHGPVPKGSSVVFKNGNKADIRLENLELLTRRELMARNTVHNLPKALAEVVQLRGALVRQINRRKKQGAAA